MCHVQHHLYKLEGPLQAPKVMTTGMYELDTCVNWRVSQVFWRLKRKMSMGWTGKFLTASLPTVTVLHPQVPRSTGCQGPQEPSSGETVLYLYCEGDFCHHGAPREVCMQAGGRDKGGGVPGTPGGMLSSVMRGRGSLQSHWESKPAQSCPSESGIYQGDLQTWKQ